MLSDKCEVNNCGKPAKYIGSLPHTGIIDMCVDCYHAVYRS
jgi:hypothetical protein